LAEGRRTHFGNPKTVHYIGSPGTGKTSTVAKILALMLELAMHTRLRIALAAPTGKAAARLQEAIKEAKSRLGCSDAVKESIPRTRPPSTASWGPFQVPRPFDTILKIRCPPTSWSLTKPPWWTWPSWPSWCRRFRARETHFCWRQGPTGFRGGRRSVGRHLRYGTSTRLFRRPIEILCESDAQTVSTDRGHPDQTGIQDCIVELRRSYRFDEKSGIRALSRAIKDGDGDRAVLLLKNGNYQDIAWMDLPHPEGLALAMKASILEGFSRPLKSSTFDEMVHAFGSFRILCALRKGPYGAMALNTHVEGALLEEKLIQRGPWYHGRPS